MRTCRLRMCNFFSDFTIVVYFCYFTCKLNKWQWCAEKLHVSISQWLLHCLMYHVKAINQKHIITTNHIIVITIKYKYEYWDPQIIPVWKHTFKKHLASLISGCSPRLSTTDVLKKLSQVSFRALKNIFGLNWFLLKGFIVSKNYKLRLRKCGCERFKVFFKKVFWGLLMQPGSTGDCTCRPLVMTEGCGNRPKHRFWRGEETVVMIGALFADFHTKTPLSSSLEEWFILNNSTEVRNESVPHPLN